MTITDRRRRSALVGVVALTVALAASACSPATGTTTRISARSSGEQLDGLSYDAVVSPDGRFVVFSSRADIPGFGELNEATLWLKDRQNGALHRVSFPDVGPDDPGGASDEPSIARSGAIAFASTETDLVSERDGNGRSRGRLPARARGHPPRCRPRSTANRGTRRAGTPASRPTVASSPSSPRRATCEAQRLGS